MAKKKKDGPEGGGWKINVPPLGADKPSHKAVTFRLPIDLYNDLSKVAEYRNIDLTALLNEILAESRPKLTESLYLLNEQRIAARLGVRVEHVRLVEVAVSVGEKRQDVAEQVEAIKKAVQSIAQLDEPSERAVILAALKLIQTPKAEVEF